MIKRAKGTVVNVILIILVIVLGIVPFFITKNAEFTGADNAAVAAITKNNPDYKPWFNTIWEPPSGAIESLLFSLQAAIGASIVFYAIGYYKGRRDAKKNVSD